MRLVMLRYITTQQVVVEVRYDEATNAFVITHEGASTYLTRTHAALYLAKLQEPNARPATLNLVAGAYRTHLGGLL